MDKELFDDLIESTKEAIEHEKGNIKLKSNIVMIPDDDFGFMYNQLLDEDRQALKIIVNKMLMANKQMI